MKRLGKLSLLSFLFGLVVATAQAQTPWSGIISSSRATNWSSAGVSGGIPSGSWAQCGSTITAYGSTGSPGSPSTINNAVTSCPPNTYVQLGAGTFYLNSGILISGHNNVAVRGMGADQTFLIFTGQNSCDGLYAAVCVESSDVNWAGGLSNGPVNWTASSYAQGTTTISLASASNLKVGNPIILDQLDDTQDIGSMLEIADTTSTFPFSSTGSPGPYMLQAAGESNRAGRSQMQITTVTQCDGNTTIGHVCASGSNISMSPGLIDPNWTPSKSPQAWWATGPENYAGVENLSIDASNDGAVGTLGAGVAFFNVNNGWVEGVRTIGTSRDSVWTELSEHITVQSNYFFLAVNSTSTSYGYECYGGSDDLVVNNVFEAIAGPLTVNGGCVDIVMAYNFATTAYYTSSVGWSMPVSNLHGSDTDFDLYEGNVGSQINADVFHGPHNMDTMFRNYMPGTYPVCWQSGSTWYSAAFGSCTGNLTPLYLLSFSRFFNVVGNVWGKSGVQTGYESGSVPVYNIGSGDEIVPNDPVVKESLLLWGNWDVVTNATRWCGSSSDTGWSTTCGSASEVPAGYAYYPNPLPTKGDTGAGQSGLPASFYYASQPPWWPSGKAWPLIGPDVSGGNIAGTGGHANTNPAEDCFLNVMGAATNGTGGPYSFDANTCYGSGSGSTSSTQPPAPPESLSATVD